MVGYIEEGGAGRDQFRLQLLPPACSSSRQDRTGESRVACKPLHAVRAALLSATNYVATGTTLLSATNYVAL